MERVVLLCFVWIAAIVSSAADTPADTVRVGAERTEVYAGDLLGRRVALLSNHTGVAGGEHTLDRLLRCGVDVRVIFSPEHGFRGTADAGETVRSEKDPETGIPIASLYGAKGERMPSAEVMNEIDVIVCDLQDVGLRFYTYYITMMDMMEAAARYGKEFVVLDRPNPNGMYVDGPVLDMTLRSGVGRLPIPVVHGMTLGEIARMITGEGWLKQDVPLDLRVVPCEGYTHSTRYELPVAPSPNLKDMQAVWLYPSTCLFEGTVMSLGRGTNSPFCIYGHPRMTGCDFRFVPRSVAGAKNPPLKDQVCYGRDLRGVAPDSIIARGVDLSYVIDARRNPGMREVKDFFTSFFDKLIGNRSVRRMIESGASAEEIRATWLPEVEEFKKLRKKYLIYPDFE